MRGDLNLKHETRFIMEMEFGELEKQRSLSITLLSL